MLPLTLLAGLRAFDPGRAPRLARRPRRRAARRAAAERQPVHLRRARRRLRRRADVAGGAGRGTPAAPAAHADRRRAVARHLRAAAARPRQGDARPDAVRRARRAHALLLARRPEPGAARAAPALGGVALPERHAPEELRLGADAAGARPDRGLVRHRPRDRGDDSARGDRAVRAGVAGTRRPAVGGLRPGVRGAVPGAAPADRRRDAADRDALRRAAARARPRRDADARPLHDARQRRLRARRGRRALRADAAPPVSEHGARGRRRAGDRRGVLAANVRADRAAAGAGVLPADGVGSAAARAGPRSAARLVQPQRSGLGLHVLPDDPSPADRVVVPVALPQAVSERGTRSACGTSDCPPTRRSGPG